MTPLVVENEPPVTFLRRKMTGGRFSMGVVIRRYTGLPGRLLVCSALVCQSVTLQFSGLFSAIFKDIDLKFSIWICLDLIQITISFVTLDLLLMSYYPLLKFSFPDFFCSLLRYWLEIWYMNLSQDVLQAEVCRAWPTFTPFPKI